MSKFDWNKLKENVNAAAKEQGGKKYEVDSRFYVLGKDENGNGGSLIRFLADVDEVPFVAMTQINAQQGKGKPFISEWSPQTIGLPDPVNERFSELWQAGKQDEAKKYGRKFRYITNIKVIKDPANPDNNGKIFLLDMAKTLFEKLDAAADPSESEIALGGEPLEIFDPIAGNNFLLKIKMGSNGFPTYEDSKFDVKTSSIYDSEAAADADIQANAYSLNEFIKPENFMSYEDLKKKLDWFDGIKAPTEVPEASETPATPATPATPTPKAETPVPEPKKADPLMDEAEDLDSLLDDLLED